jgi:hypothetical protein
MRWMGIRRNKATERGSIEKTAAVLREAQQRLAKIAAQSRRAEEIGATANAAKLDGGVGNWIPRLIASRGE